MDGLLCQNDDDEREAEYEPAIRVVYQGLLPFRDARVLQEQLVKERYAGKCCDVVLLCEHPPTLSLGRRTDPRDISEILKTGRREGLEIVHVTRGGAATCHGPGQLVVYPVIKLSQRKLGVKRFVMRMLFAIEDLARSYGLDRVVARLDPAGVWVVECPDDEFSLLHSRKIASVGLRVWRGITDHGFSINVDCDLGIFQRFTACGYPGLNVTSLTEELRSSQVGFSIEAVATRFKRIVSNKLT